MLFNDPLAILQYLGGPVPNHLSMIMYASFIYFVDWDRLNDCTTDHPELKGKLQNFEDVKWMIIAHSFNILLHFIKKSLSKKSDLTFYLRTFCTIVMFSTYMAAYLSV